MKSKIHQPNDKSYKEFLQVSQNFLELLKGFVKEDWVKDIEENSLKLENNSFILKDYQDRESDIIYTMNINDGKDGKVIFYVLLELQTKVDYTMPFRLLIYMTEIWKQYFDNTPEKERERKGFKLPVIIPMVLYNEKNRWTAVRSFREMQMGEKRFGNHVLNFEYMLFDVIRYSKNELFEISNIMSAVFYLDQEKDGEHLIERLRELAKSIEEINKSQWLQIINWIRYILIDRLPVDGKEDMEKVLEEVNKMEGNDMVSNLGRAIDKMLQKSEAKGRLEGEARGEVKGEVKGKLNMAKDTAIEMLLDGEPIERIVKYSKLGEKEIMELKTKLLH